MDQLLKYQFEAIFPGCRLLDIHEYLMEKGVSLEDHATHLIVHGLLHLAGHDHVDSDEQAEAMEALEIAALAKLGIADPYGDRN
jgi:ssRNA-specific RNase YbeY (16S rRNA maturation enzyme)